MLVWPDLQAGSLGRRELIASLSLIGGSFSWALGSVLSKKWQSGMDVFGATGWQVTAAGVGNLLFALLNGDLKHATWSPRSLAAVGYLVVCGSWIGYTAYIWLLEHVPTSKVSTYAYVNPVVAVFLGWLVLHEKVDRFILAGSAVVVLSVILVTSAKVREKAVCGGDGGGGSGGGLRGNCRFSVPIWPADVILNAGEAAVRDRATAGRFDVVEGKAQSACGVRDLGYRIAALCAS